MQDWKPEEKLAIVVEVGGLSCGELGVFVRSAEISSALLDEWRHHALTGLRGTQQVGATVGGDPEIRDGVDCSRIVRGAHSPETCSKRTGSFLCIHVRSICSRQLPGGTVAGTVNAI